MLSSLGTAPILVYGLLLAAALALLGLLLHRHRLRSERDALLQEKEVIFGFVHDVAEVFAETDEVDLEPLLKRVLFYAQRTTRAGAGAIFLLEPDGRHLRAKATAGIFPPLTGAMDAGLDRAVSKSQHVEHLVRTRLIERGEGLVGMVADRGTPLLIGDAETDQRVPRYSIDFLRIHSLILVPMRFQQAVMGVLCMINPVDGEPFSPADLNLLQALADQASVSIHYAGLRETLLAKQRIDHDLGIAKRIQKSLLPRDIPRVGQIELAAFNHPAQEVGGDYYDFIEVDAQHLGIALADVSGKGISGAIMMSVCRSLLRAQAAGNPDPAQVLCALNNTLSRDITEDMFISVLYMVLDRETRELEIARAGHERPLLYSGEHGRFTVVDSSGMAIGIADPATFEHQLRKTSLRLQPGDIVVAYTDGITEAMNMQEEEWGMERFMAAIRTAAEEGAHSVLNNVRERLIRFVGNHPQYDDMTLIALRFMR